MTRTSRYARASALAIAVLAALAVSASAAPATSPSAARADMNIVQTAAAAGQFTTLVKLVKQAGLASALSARGPLTVFAPTDAAFAKVPKKTLAALAKDKTKLRHVLLYHVVSGNVKAAQVVGLKSATTLAKQPVRIAVRGGVVYLNKTTRVVKTDIAASNGVIHVVNTVLIPPA
jgi:uncharacterized surface protein with fasciclin (FAS1) repeats